MHASMKPTFSSCTTSLSLISTTFMFLQAETSAALLALRIIFENTGISIAIKIPITAITMMSSTIVKPDLYFFIIPPFTFKYSII